MFKQIQKLEDSYVCDTSLINYWFNQKTWPDNKLSGANEQRVIKHRQKSFCGLLNETHF